MLHLQLFLLPIRPHIETQARLHATQHTDQAAFHPIPNRDLLRHFLLVRLAGGKILHRAVQTTGLGQRWLFDFLRELLGVFSELGQGHLLMPKIADLPERVLDGPQAPPKYQSVGSRYHPLNQVPEFRNKLVHVVVLLLGCLSRNKHHTAGTTPPLFWLPLRRAVFIDPGSSTWPQVVKAIRALTDPRHP